MPRLKKYDFNVPGGYQYVQPETGMQFNGNTPFRAQVGLITAHRKANNLPRATLDEVWMDLETFTCNRVPSRCIDSNATANARRRTVRRCGGCGGRRAK